MNHRVDWIVYADGSQPHEYRADEMRTAEIREEEGESYSDEEGKEMLRELHSPIELIQYGKIQSYPNRLS